MTDEGTAEYTPQVITKGEPSAPVATETQETVEDSYLGSVKELPEKPIELWEQDNKTLFINELIGRSDAMLNQKEVIALDTFIRNRIAVQGKSATIGVYGNMYKDLMKTIGYAEGEYIGDALVRVVNFLYG